MTKILNFTPHDINIVGEDNTVVSTIPSTGLIRLKSATERVAVLEGVPISKTVFGEPEGLPEQETSVFYIVSQLVKTALPNRSDLLVPAELVRDDQGNIIGCKSLGV
jgi:hypothetical protein